jgi:hypothetical protein
MEMMIVMVILAAPMLAVWAVIDLSPASRRGEFEQNTE